MDSGKVYGVVGGILLFKCAESLSAGLATIFIGIGDFYLSLLAASQSLIPAIFYAVFGYLYIRDLCARWTHILFLVVLYLGVIAKVGGSVSLLFVDAESDLRMSALSSSSVAIIVAVILSISVFRLMRQEKATPNK